MGLDYGESVTARQSANFIEITPPTISTQPSKNVDIQIQ
jgi:hypothetical protein